VTEIDRDYPGDTYFPAIPEEFRETERSHHQDQADPTLRYDFVTYER
jgi:dihydrofolate reductase